MHNPTLFAPLSTKPDYARCLERIDAWFHQTVLDRPPVRLYKHNAQFDAGELLDKLRWDSLEQRWFASSSALGCARARKRKRSGASSAGDAEDMAVQS